MTDRERVRKLLELAGWRGSAFGVYEDEAGGVYEAGQGFRPTHYKRNTIPEADRERLCEIAMVQLYGHFDGNARPFYTQALIAGALLSGEYDKIAIISPSQYGKSQLMGWLSLMYAYMGHKVNIAAATSDKTEIIMRYCMSAAATANIDVKKALTQESLKKVDKLDQSISKTRLSFPGRGSVQGVTLGETFADVSRNKAIGESGAWIVDEAALVSSDAMAEIGRREFSSVDGTVEPLVMISNPHNPGYFYDFVTKEKMKPRECVIWMDILTSVQEGRTTVDRVMSSEFIDHRETLQKYLLCELPTVGSGMFDDVRVRTARTQRDAVTVLGVDAAYKGKDKIKVCRCDIEAEYVYFSEIITVEKKEWIDGVTSQDIIRLIAKLYHGLNAALCCVDEGWGVWLKEGLVLHGVNARGINFNSKPTPERKQKRKYAALNAYNKRAEMHLDLQDLIEHQACEFAPEVYKEIEAVLPHVTSERKTSGIQIVPKPEIAAKIGHSPDAFDAVLLALHAVVLYGLDRPAYITERTHNREGEQ